MHSGGPAWSRCTQIICMGGCNSQCIACHWSLKIEEQRARYKLERRWRVAVLPCCRAAVSMNSCSPARPVKTKLVWGGPVPGCGNSLCMHHDGGTFELGGLVSIQHSPTNCIYLFSIGSSNLVAQPRMCKAKEEKDPTERPLARNEPKAARMACEKASPPGQRAPVGAAVGCLATRPHQWGGNEALLPAHRLLRLSLLCHHLRR